MIVVMQAGPTTTNWSGTRIHETVKFGANTCLIKLADAARVCENGHMPDFIFGLPNRSISYTVPVANIRVALLVDSSVDLNNSFFDAHFAFNSGDMLGTVGGSCTIDCTQNYTCGTGPRAVSYGPFTITYSFVHGTYQPPFSWTAPKIPVTRVNTTKR